MLSFWNPQRGNRFRILFYPRFSEITVAVPVWKEQSFRPNFRRTHRNAEVFFCGVLRSDAGLPPKCKLDSSNITLHERVAGPSFRIEEVFRWERESLLPEIVNAV